MFKIIDWAGNECFPKHGPWEDFEDAWGFIREQVPDEEDWQEYEVVPASHLRESRYLERNHPSAGRKVYDPDSQH